MRILLVGGPAAGDVWDIEEAQDYVQVPLMEKQQCQPLAMLSPEPDAVPYSAALYRRCRIYAPVGGVSFMRPDKWTDKQAIEELLRGYRAPK